jgi:hypothetical protein
MISITAAVFITAVCCCLTALYVRGLTIRQGRSALREMAERAQVQITALVRGIQDEGRLLGMNGVEHLAAVFQQSKKHGGVFVMVPPEEKHDEHTANPVNPN